MLPIPTTEFYPRKWAVLIPLAISGVIFFSAWKSQTFFLYYVGGFLALFSILLLWYVQKTKLVISEQGIASITRISTREMLWKDIVRSYLKFHPHGTRGGTYYWHFETADGRRIFFAARPYARKDLQAIANAVMARCSHAQIDEKVAGLTIL